jgi:glutamine synthetase adenylyltransferase
MKAEGKKDVAERAKAFALDVIRTIDALPRMTAAQVLGKQVRSALAKTYEFFRLCHSAFCLCTMTCVDFS